MEEDVGEGAGLRCVKESERHKECSQKSGFERLAGRGK